MLVPFLGSTRTPLYKEKRPRNWCKEPYSLKEIKSLRQIKIKLRSSNSLFRSNFFLWCWARFPLLWILVLHLEQRVCSHELQTISDLFSSHSWQKTNKYCSCFSWKFSPFIQNLQNFLFSHNSQLNFMSEESYFSQQKVLLHSIKQKKLHLNYFLAFQILFILFYYIEQKNFPLNILLKLLLQKNRKK